ncbi:Uncharacterized protein TCM_016160 [Theobroma cacao]|uniref:Uncharacterized protein n=1 Tax=Theobroma cacao TaxID=3641 RepID=A0A061GC24_THECC|nr:Uncharacterized protein TCM_016160 [Theobroma cacao]
MVETMGPSEKQLRETGLRGTGKGRAEICVVIGCGTLRYEGGPTTSSRTTPPTNRTEIGPSPDPYLHV